MNALTPMVPIGSKPVSVAVLAMGGQGGGVLMDWIVALAESQGFIAQSTSVPGVAQRTGATIYYVEMVKARADGRYPVLALMPSPGDVDVVIGAELMEAGRAMQRGLVTPGKTTLITSSHRSYAVQEKIALGDGVSDSDKVYAAARAAAKRFIAFDMATLAEQAGSAISAVMFGALSGAEAFPFPRGAYEATIRASGLGVDASLRAFAAGHEAASANRPPPPAQHRVKVEVKLESVGHRGFDALIARARNDFPPGAHPMLAAGLRRVVDFQDVAYGREYLDLVATFIPFERGGDPQLVSAAAKYIAVAMTYDDVIRVADLKTRGSRFARVRAEVLANPRQLIYTTEFMHPRMEEVAGTLPVGLGRWLEARPRLFRALDRLVNKGRRVRTGTIRWFLPLYILAGMHRFRRHLLRHQREVAHRDAWLDAARKVAPHDYALAVAMIELRRLVKGYSDTHARGLSKFDKVLAAALRLAGRTDAADWTHRLQRAALSEEGETTLEGALQTVETFLPPDQDRRTT
jgi:indolepyruvate ferredoxin oxidoreductase, beta subunit